MTKIISFIGAGNMAASLIGGLVSDGHKPDHIRAADPSAEQCERVRREFGIEIFDDNNEAIDGADIVVLAVKPQVMPEVASALSATAAENRPLVISVAAGIREPDLRRWLGYDAAIVRTMPNTPALVQCGATALFANEFVDQAAGDDAQGVMRAVGITEWVEHEVLLDAVTAVSGSGPAYCFLLLELMTNTGVSMGLDKPVAKRLALQTALGAATMAMKSEHNPARLRENVTSPGGTTEAALNILYEGGVEALFDRALKGAQARAVELGQMLGDD